jgi:NADH-quinone oxidoreductase subunit G
LLNLEPELDAYNPQAATKTLGAADLVVMMSAYKRNTSVDTDYVDVMLPISPFTETSGTFINTEGRVQNFNGIVTPLGDTRPAWKILRVLGNLMQLEGFDFDNPEQVYAEAIPPDLDIKKNLVNELNNFTVNTFRQESNSMQRIAEVPIYQTDPIVRHAESLQLTRDAIEEPVAWMPGNLLEKLGLCAGDKVELKQGEGEASLRVDCDDKVPPNCIRLVTAHPMTASLGGMFGDITVKKCDG